MFARSLKSGTALATIALVFAVQTEVRAADADIPPPPRPPAPPLEFRESVIDWSGAYGGLHLGYTFFDTDYLPTGAPDPNVDGEGVSGGGLLGYNLQYDNWVYGIEGDFTFSDASGISQSNKFNAEIMTSVRGRLGYALGHGLYYVTGGVAFADLDINSTQFRGKDDAFLFGWTVGGGGEWMIDEGVSVRAEYLYSSFDDDDFTFTAGGINSGLDDVHTVRGALVFSLDRLLY